MDLEIFIIALLGAQHATLMLRFLCGKEMKFHHHQIHFPSVRILLK